MQSPEQVAEFVSWIQWLIEFAIAVGSLPQLLWTLCLQADAFQRILEGIGSAIGRAIADLFLGVAILGMVVIAVLVLGLLTLLVVCLRK